MKFPEKIIVQHKIEIIAQSELSLTASKEKQMGFKISSGPSAQDLGVALAELEAVLNKHPHVFTSAELETL